MIPAPYPDPELLEERRRRAVVERWGLRLGMVAAFVTLYVNLFLGIGVIAFASASGGGWTPFAVVGAVVGGAAPVGFLFALIARFLRPGRLAQLEVCAVLGLEFKGGWWRSFTVVIAVAILLGALQAIGLRFTEVFPAVLVLVAFSSFGFARRRFEPDFPRSVAVSIAAVYLSIACLVVALEGWIGIGQGSLAIVVVATTPWMLLGLARERVKQRIRAGATGWIAVLAVLLPVFDRLELQLEAGEVDKVLPRLHALLARSLNRQFVERTIVLTARALEQLEDPRLVPVICAGCAHYPISAPLHLLLAEHAPDAATGLAYAEFAEATALRSGLDPAPYVRVRERLQHTLAG